MKYTNNTIKINFTFVFCIVFLFVIFFVKLSYVSLSNTVEGTDLQELADNRSTVTKTLTAERGKIYDNAGNLLAQNVNSYTLIAYLSKSRTTDDRYPKHVVDKETTARQLAEILQPLNENTTYEYILGRLNTPNVYQVEFGTGGRNLTELVKQKIKALALPGIDFIKTSKRYYQNGDFASYIIGYAKKDDNEVIKGELGIEGYCDRFLKGTDGSITYQKDAYGYKMQLSSGDTVSYEVPAQDGYDVYLTLDKQVQIFLDNAVLEFTRFNPEWVTITVADADTGAIIGSSTSPSFNPNKLNITNYNNPLTSYTYEPGSTMKIFSFMSAIEEGKYNGADTYHSGTIEVADYKIKDWNNTGWGTITYDTGFTYSSNVAAVKLAQKLGKKTLYSYYTGLGFGSKTGIELANEYSGDIGFDYETELATASFGQGVTVTPIQMIQALTTLTNDGTVLKPYIIKKIIDPNNNEVVYKGEKKELNKMYSTSTVNKMIELLDATVNGEDGQATGKVYSTPNVRLIGKTGTANYIEDGSYITGNKKTIRSFAGVFPKEKPEYIIYVAVKDFQGTSKNMGTIVKNLVESISKYKNLDERVSDKDDSKIIKVDNYINKSVISSTAKIDNLGASYIIIGDGATVINQYPKKNTKTSQKSKIFLVTNGTNITMPNIVGWSSSEVVDFCNLVGLKYELSGYGYVSESSIPAGTIIDKENMTLTTSLVNLNPQLFAKQEGEPDENGEQKTT